MLAPTKDLSVVPSLEKLASGLKSANDAAELRDAMGQTIERLGFDHFAICHYILDRDRTMVFSFSSMPERWQTSVPMVHHWTHCPIAAACQRTASGFAWSDLPSLIELDDNRQRVLAFAKECGLGDGYSIPANVPASVSGSISFAVKRGRPLPRENFPATHFLAAIAYSTSLRIAQQAQVTSESQKLSRRQVECIVLAAQGKTDWEIGQILAISKDTAHKHIQAAMQRLEVTTRTQLVVRALYLSQITLGEALS